MALLKLNGIEVQATASEWEPVRMGEVVRSLNGAPRSTAKVRKANIRFTSGLLTVPEAQALRSLIEGEGEVLSFDDDSSATSYLYTSREAAPLLASGVSRATDFPWRGNGNLRVASGGLVTWSVASVHELTVLYFGRLVAPDPSGWSHFAWSSAAGRWVNGVNYPSEGPPAGLLIDEDTPAVGFQCPPGISTYDVDDAVILPFSASAAWITAFHAFHTGPESRAWPALPYVLAEGPRFPVTGQLCLGEVASSPARLLRDSVAEVLDFTLYGT